MSKSGPLTGQLQYFRSRVDGQLHPYAVCATDATSEPKPLILQVNPGFFGDLFQAVRLTEEIAGIARKHRQPCVVLRPSGRGQGTVYQNYGEVDVFEAIEHVASLHAIDRRRISVTGASMGGAATWYLITHYPDFFAAGAPWCGYCDYRLWEKPGGMTSPLHEWEEFSWKSRSAAFLAENLAHTPVWMVHGEWDRAVGGGVSVEHSRRMAALMKARGFPHRYTEIPKTGHNSAFPKIWEKVVLWLLRQRKAASPDHVELATWSLRHNRSYWVTVDQLARYGERGLIRARRTGRAKVSIATRNIRTFSVGPLENCESGSTTIDGQKPIPASLRFPQTFRKNRAGIWGPLDAIPADEKRRGASGPIGDLFHEEVVLVPGTIGGEAETFFNQWAARNALSYYQSRNGGVHRGGILGENAVQLPIIPDVELGDGPAAEKNLLLFGTHASNAILKKWGRRLPLVFGKNMVRLFGKTYRGKRPAVFALFPHPKNPERYLAVHGGGAPDAICWGSHLDMHLPPDFLVYAEGRLLDWGFCGNDWKRQGR